MDKPVIRTLSDGDVQEFWQLRLRALKEEPEAFGSAYEESVGTPISDVTKKLECSDNSFVLGAFNPQLIGIVGFFRMQGMKRRHKGTIWGMYVAPEGRGLGLGRDLMVAAISRAANLPELDQLLLTVTNDAARNLYSSLGFKSFGLEPDALKLGDRCLDEHNMVLKLAGASKHKDT